MLLGIVDGLGTDVHSGNFRTRTMQKPRAVSAAAGKIEDPFVLFDPFGCEDVALDVIDPDLLQRAAILPSVIARR